jgi:glucose 1-dehydrogenase
MKHFIPLHNGKLINILGAGWNKPVPYQNAYSSSKVWIRWFTKSLAEETRASGVGVYALNPGMVLTELLTDVEVFENAKSRLDKFPMVVRVLAKPPEVPAKKVAWLASSATDGQTGLEINVFNSFQVTIGFMMEGIRSMIGKPEPPTQVKIKVVPPR